MTKYKNRLNRLNRLNKRKQLEFENEFEKFNSVNLLKKSDFDLFPVSNSNREITINIKRILHYIRTTPKNNIIVIKLFDYIILYKHLFSNIDDEKNISLQKIIHAKLLEFSKDINFGPMRSKHYIRVIFPDGKCLHKSKLNGNFCVYAKYKNFDYCRTHCEFIQSYVKIIENNTKLYTAVVLLIVYYL
jgi:hypothetical protein